MVSLRNVLHSIQTSSRPHIYSVSKAVSVVHVCRQTEMKVRHLLVEKVKGVCEGPAVELGFDPLRVCVWGELLAQVLRH